MSDPKPLKPSQQIKGYYTREYVSEGVRGVSFADADDVRKVVDALHDRLDELEHLARNKFEIGKTPDTVRESHCCDCLGCDHSPTLRCEKCTVLYMHGAVPFKMGNKPQPSPAKSCPPTNTQETYDWRKKLLVEAGVKDVDAILTKPDAVREPVWCEHITYESNPNGHPIYPSIKQWTYFNGYFNDTSKWKFCPICAAPRNKPQPSVVKECEHDMYQPTMGSGSYCTKCGWSDDMPTYKEEKGEKRLAHLLIEAVEDNNSDKAAQIALAEFERVIDDAIRLQLLHRTNMDTLKKKLREDLL